MEFFSQLFGWLPAGIEAILQWFTTVTGSAGVAIILLTILIRGLLFPLTQKQTESMLAMREIQPKAQEIQKKYKDNPQEYQKRVMELYREAGVNPLGGCLPLLVQFPFLIALFQVLRTATFENADPQFLFWTLTEPDGLYILPLLSGVTTYLQSKMTMTDPSQKALLYIMPVFITWISVSFPTGLVLYWVVSNVFSIGQQYVLLKKYPESRRGANAK